MKRKIFLEAKKIAKEAGYHDIREVESWKGFRVFEPIFTDGLIHCIGYPQYILIKGDVIRWADGDRCEEIMDFQLEALKQGR